MKRTEASPSSGTAWSEGKTGRGASGANCQAEGKRQHKEDGRGGREYNRRTKGREGGSEEGPWGEGRRGAPPANNDNGSEEESARQ